MSDIEREAFEKTYSSVFPGHRLDRDINGDYVNVAAQAAWRVHQAARQAPASWEVEPVGYTWDAGRFGRQFTDDKEVAERVKLDGVQVEAVHTHPPAKVPEWIPKTLGRLADSIRGDCYMGEEWELETIDSVLSSLRTTPTPATTPETEWVKCAQTLPAKDHPFQCWYCPVPDSKSPIVVLTSARAVRNMFSTGNAPDARWMCSGINVPTPPQEQ